METTYIVLIILTAIYVPLWFYVKFGKKFGLKGAEKLEEKGIGPYGPTIMIRTKVGFKVINYLGRYKRFWRVCGILSRIVTIILMTYIVAIIILDLLRTLQSELLAELDVDPERDVNHREDDEDDVCRFHGLSSL